MVNDILRRTGLENTILVAWRNQLSQIRLTLLASLTVGLGGIIAVYLLSRFTGVPPAWLTRDPADVTGSKIYIGMLSTLGIMGWAAATAICFEAASLLWHDKRFRPSAFFLLMSGLLCLILTFDDAFMFHERVLPGHFHIPEKGVLLGYLLIIVGYGAYFFRRILKTDYLLLVLALFFAGLSAMVYQILSLPDLEAFAKDCPKFLGIVLWLAYYSRTAFVMVKEMCLSPIT
jgi:hypothetical protein